MLKSVAVALLSFGAFATTAAADDPAAVTWGTKPVVWTLTSRTVRPPPPPAIRERDVLMGTKPVVWSRPVTFPATVAKADANFGLKPVLWTTRAR